MRTRSGSRRPRARAAAAESAAAARPALDVLGRRRAAPRLPRAHRRDASRAPCTTTARCCAPTSPRSSTASRSTASPPRTSTRYVKTKRYPGPPARPAGRLRTKTVVNQLTFAHAVFERAVTDAPRAPQPGRCQRAAQAAEDGSRHPLPDRRGAARRDPRRARRRARPDRSARSAPRRRHDRDAPGRAPRPALARRRLAAPAASASSRPSSATARIGGPKWDSHRDRADQRRARRRARAALPGRDLPGRRRPRLLPSHRPAGRTTTPRSARGSTPRSPPPASASASPSTACATPSARTMASAGTPQRTLQGYMGHRQASTTEIYTHFAADPLEGRRLVERAFGTPTSGAQFGAQSERTPSRTDPHSSPQG